MQWKRIEEKDFFLQLQISLGKRLEIHALHRMDLHESFFLYIRETKKMRTFSPICIFFPLLLLFYIVRANRIRIEWNVGRFFFVCSYFRTMISSCQPTRYIRKNGKLHFESLSTNLNVSRKFLLVHGNEVIYNAVFVTE